MVWFGNHLTQFEKVGADKRFPDKCRQTIGKSEYFRTTFLPTKGGELKLFPIWDALRTTTSYFIRTGMHLRSRKMVQYNGFPNRLLELVRIFTVRLMMTRWRWLCIKFVGSDMIKRVIHGNRSHIYTDILAWWKCSFTTSDTEVLLLDTVLQSVHMKVTDNTRTFTPHRGRLFPYMKHLRKPSCQRRWNSFWRTGHRWWRSFINISSLRIVRISSIQVVYLHATGDIQLGSIRFWQS